MNAMSRMKRRFRSILFYFVGSEPSDATIYFLGWVFSNSSKARIEFPKTEAGM
jgi:hypothetical protein